MSHHTGPAEAADAAADLSPGQLITEDAPKRTYQKAAASETLEDYSLRYAPYSFRRWTPFVVATTAIGGIAYLADFAIGASIVLTHGGPSGVLAILAAAAIIFVTGVPIARACAKYGVDMDLLTRGAGFGYLGSTLTSLIYASFTFIFFALEGSIMAQGFELAFGMPLWLGYLVTSLMIIPIVVYGMKALSKLHVWTRPSGCSCSSPRSSRSRSRTPGRTATWPPSRAPMVRTLASTGPASGSAWESRSP